jgi:diaminopimelate decarboxylase
MLEWEMPFYSLVLKRRKTLPLCLEVGQFSENNEFTQLVERTNICGVCVVTHAIYNAHLSICIRDSERERERERERKARIEMTIGGKACEALYVLGKWVLKTLCSSFP